MTSVQRLLSFLLCAALTGCASSGSATHEGSKSLLVTLHDFKSGTRFELASESHTDRVKYYSDARGDASRKVVSDEFMSALVGELERQGLGAHAQAGRAPSTAPGGVISWGLEVEDGETSTHWLIGKGSAPADWKEFQYCRDMFLEMYNATTSFQAVKNPSGKQLFDDKKPAAADGKHP